MSKAEPVKNQEPEQPQKPYPGLRPFTEAERGQFFGREADQAILVDKLLANRLTLLFAASGVGKSSLLQAAVIPYLREADGENLTVFCQRQWWGDRAADEAFRQALLDGLLAQQVLQDEDIEALAGQELPEVLAYVCLLVRPPLILVLDQFEEFFRYQRGKQGFRALIAQLTQVIIDKSLAVSVVLSMREDFALELNAFKPDLPMLLFQNFYRLEKLDQEAAGQAITGPVALYGFEYQTDLLDALLEELPSKQSDSPTTERLLQDEGDKRVEPAHLQIVCERLWQLAHQDEGGQLRLSHYEQAGRAKGIVKRFLQRTLAQFKPRDLQLLSRAFDYLVAQRHAKVAWPLDKLAQGLRVKPERLQGVLDRLTTADKRVLNRQEYGGVLWYELYHDVFSKPVEQWNNAFKARQLRRQRWTIRGLLLVVGLVTALLLDSLWWLMQNSHFPVGYLFQQQKFRLMDWGLLDEPLPEMVKILASQGEVVIGERDTGFAESYVDFLKGQGAYGQQNFAYPTIKVSFSDVFYAGRYEVTYEQYDYYVWQQHRSGLSKEDLGYPTGGTRDNGRGDRPVTQVNWDEAVAYTRWLSKKTGQDYRLPTEAEWEYMARAGSDTAYPWGDGMGANQANCIDCDSNNPYKQLLAPVGSFPANKWGLHDTVGNVWEWTCSTWQADFSQEASTRCATEGDDTRRVLRGGSWFTSSHWVRSSVRTWYNSNNRYDSVGFRVIYSPRQDK